MRVEILKKLAHPLLFFVYKDEEKGIFRGVCLPFFITIERKTKAEAKKGILERFNDFLDIVESNNFDINKMYQIPEYEMDFLVAKESYNVANIFEKRMIEGFEKELKKKSVEKVKPAEKKVFSFRKKEKSYRKPVWSEMGEATLFATAPC